MNRKKCCILFNKPREGALPDELDVLDQVEFVEENLGKLGIATYRKGITADFMNEITELAAEKTDFVFNLVESINNKGELAYFIPALLNLHSIPYTGNPLEALFITTSKILTDKILRQNKINTPATFLPSQHQLLRQGRKYIIKPVWEDGSLDITSDSVIAYDDLQLKRLEGLSDSHWIVQEFIEGREFNISILHGSRGPLVMPPAEMIFRNFGSLRPKIVDFRAKWIEDSFEYENTRREFPGEKLNPALAEKISDIAISCWKIFGLKGYARVDMRVDQNDIPHVIEINANPCISPNSGLVAATLQAGMTFTEVLERILDDLNY